MSARGTSVKGRGLLLRAIRRRLRVVLTVRGVGLLVVIRGVRGAGLRVVCVVRRVASGSLVVRTVYERCSL